MESRRKLAIAILCYSYLRNQGFITSEDREGIFGRILSWAYKNKISISKAQADSANFVYDDNAKEEEE